MSPNPTSPTVRSEIGAFAELFALSGLAFAQPYFDLLGKNTDVLVGQHATSRDGLVIAFLALFLVPAVWFAVEILAGLIAARLRTLVHRVGLFIAGAVLFAEWSKASTSAGPTLVVLAGLGGATVLVIAVARYSAVRRWLRVLAVAPIAFAVLFLAASPATPVLFGNRDGQIADVAVRRPNRVVWIVFDEFPVTSLLDGNGQVDGELFPNFAALAATSNWYRNSTTIAPFTSQAVPGMLSGTVPESDVAATVANYPRNVFTLLGNTYDIHALQQLTDMCPLSACPNVSTRSGRSASLGGLIRDSLDLWGEFASPKRTPPGLDAMRGVLAFDADPMGTAQRFITSIAPSDGPRFDFLHVLLPHWSWRYVASRQTTGEPTNPPGLAADRWSSAWAAQSGRAQHLLQTQATDTVLGQIMDKLKAVNGWDDTLFVVTADHGVGFEPGQPARGLGPTNAPDVVWTPLFIKAPGQTSGKVDDRLARSTDILPTIADMLGIDVPWKLDGRSLLGRPRRETKVAVSHWRIDSVEPADGRFNIVNVREGFRQVLKAQARAPVGDPALRIYRVGPYGDLVGRPVAELDPVRAPAFSAAITDPAKYDAVDPTAASAPWLMIRGSVAAEHADVPMAISVNGVIAAVTQSVPGVGNGVAPWWAPLPPQLFRAGANTVEVFRITGTPAAPHLTSAAS